VALQGSEGPWSNSNLGPSLSVPSTSPSLPFPSPFPSPTLPQPSPSPAAKRPSNPARGSEGALWAPPVGSGAEPQPKSNLVHFTHFVVCCYFFRSRPIIFFPKFFLWPHYSGPQELGGPLHWTAWTPGSYATVKTVSMLRWVTWSNVIIVGLFLSSPPPCYLWAMCIERRRNTTRRYFFSNICRDYKNFSRPAGTRKSRWRDG